MLSTDPSTKLQIQPGYYEAAAVIVIDRYDE